MKTKYLISLILAIALSHSAYAGFYLRGGILYNEMPNLDVEGISDFSSSIENSAGISAALGFKLSALRIEAEINYQDSDIANTDYVDLITSGNFERTSFFANLLIDVPGTPFIEPYVGAGIGITNLSMDFASALNPFGNSSDVAFSSSADESVFSFQAMAGLRFSLFDMVSVYGGYRYVILESITVDEGSYKLSPDGGSHVFEIGAGIGF